MLFSAMNRKSNEISLILQNTLSTEQLARRTSDFEPSTYVWPHTPPAPSTTIFYSLYVRLTYDTIPLMTFLNPPANVVLIRLLTVCTRKPGAIRLCGSLLPSGVGGGGLHYPILV